MTHIAEIDIRWVADLMRKLEVQDPTPRSDTQVEDEIRSRRLLRDAERQAAVHALFRPRPPDSDHLQMAFAAAERAGVPL